MKNLNLISGVLLFFLGLGICITSLTYPIGSFKSPGGGLFPLLTSVVLMGLSGITLIQALVKRENQKGRFFVSKEGPKMILLVIIFLVGFRYLLPVIGFGVSTFLFIFCSARFLGHYSWKMSLLFSVLAAGISYTVFQVLLKIPMPQALFRIW